MHKPVLLREVVQFLDIQPNGFYVDGTLGLGGHAEAIVRKLGPQGKLLGIDVDETNLTRAKDRLQPLGDQTFTRRSNFRGLPGVLQELGWKEVNGIILDLGVSSAQLDNPERGFSFQNEGPLDMRLDPKSPQSAFSFLSTISEDELVAALKKFGEYRNTRFLSKEILRGVREGRIQTTKELSRVCEKFLGRRGGIHPATRVFLALRSLVNEEEEALKEFLGLFPAFLARQGRIGIISFHSGEDRLVKNRFSELEREGWQNKKFMRVTKKPVVATEEETLINPRARSAKLRVLERVG